MHNAVSKIFCALFVHRFWHSELTKPLNDVLRGFACLKIVSSSQGDSFRKSAHQFLSLMTNYAGEGASAGMRPSCRSSSHNAAGIEYDIIWKFSSASETVRGPGIAAVTAG